MECGDKSPHSKKRTGASIKFSLAPARSCANSFNYFFAGDAAFAGDAGVLPAGDALDAAAGVALPAGFAASGEAGRKPRLLGLVSMSAARLFTILASDIATSSKAVFKIFLRSSVSLTAICWRTP